MRLTPTKKNTKVNYTQSRDRVKVEGKVEFTGGSVKGQSMTLQQVTTVVDLSVTGVGTVTSTLTGLIPAGSLVLGVDARVLTILTGAVGTWSLGVTASTTRFGTTLALAAGTTCNSLTAGSASFLWPQVFTAATDVLLTSSSGNWATGTVRVTIHYFSLTPATS